MSDKTGSVVNDNLNSPGPRKRPPRRRRDPPEVYQVVVTCRDENEQKRLFQQLRKKHRVRLLVL